MYTRRKFIIQGSMATTAVLALKPLKVASRAILPFNGLGNSYGKLIFLHTANTDPQFDYKVIQHIDVQINNANVIVLQAGQVAHQDKPGAVAYDYCIDEINKNPAIPNDYKIIRKGTIKTGLISAKLDDVDVLQKVNSLSAFLKKEKGCNVVVCLSQLGYKNKNSLDDITLAKQSRHLDFIIGGNTKNVHQHPVILLNQNNEEVIIHSSVSDSAAFGKIDIDFNEEGQKMQISFSNS